MFCRTHCLLLAGVIGIAASSSTAPAQVVRTLTASATVPDIGVVASVSQLQWAEQGQADESAASGTVNTKHNGPYLLQVRLTTAHPDTVMARRPDGTWAILDVEWTTVATGPGGANTSNSVDYRIKAPNGSAPATTIPVTYRVVAPNGT